MNDGGPAFPRTEVEWEGTRGTEGMSLRDWFAGMVLANAAFRMVNPAHHANLAYQIADAMIAAREGNKTCPA